MRYKIPTRYKINLKKAKKSEIKKIFKEALSEYGFSGSMKKVHVALLKHNTVYRYIYTKSDYGYMLGTDVIKYKNRYYALVLIEIKDSDYKIYFKKECTDYEQAAHASYEASAMENPLVEYEEHIIIRIFNKFAELVSMMHRKLSAKYA